MRKKDPSEDVDRFKVRQRAVHFSLFLSCNTVTAAGELKVLANLRSFTSRQAKEADTTRDF